MQKMTLDNCCNTGFSKEKKLNVFRLLDVHGEWCPVCLRYFTNEDKIERHHIYPLNCITKVKNEFNEPIKIDSLFNQAIRVHAECHVPIIQSRSNTFATPITSFFEENVKTQRAFTEKLNRLGMFQLSRIIASVNLKKQSKTSDDYLYKIKEFFYTAGGDKSVGLVDLSRCHEELCNMYDNKKIGKKEFTKALYLEAGPLLDLGCHKKYCEIIKQARENDISTNLEDEVLRAMRKRREAQFNGMYNDAMESEKITEQYADSNWSRYTATVSKLTSSVHSGSMAQGTDFADEYIGKYKIFSPDLCWSSPHMKEFFTNGMNLFHATSILASLIYDSYLRYVKSNPKNIKLISNSIKYSYKLQYLQGLFGINQLPLWNPFEELTCKIPIDVSETLSCLIETFHFSKERCEDMRHEAFGKHHLMSILGTVESILNESFLEATVSI